MSNTFNRKEIGVIHHNLCTWLHTAHLGAQLAINVSCSQIESSATLRKSNLTQRLKFSFHQTRSGLSFPSKLINMTPYTKFLFSSCIVEDRRWLAQWLVLIGLKNKFRLVEISPRRQKPAKRHIGISENTKFLALIIKC